MSDAETNGSVDIFKLIGLGKTISVLAELKANPQEVNAVSDNGLSVFEALLEAGFTKTAMCLLSFEQFDVNQSGHNPLRSAIAVGSIELAKKLLEKGTSPNYRPEGISSALLLCLENEYFDLAETMVEHAAEVDIRNAQGWTPLIWASMKGRHKAVDFLLKHNANIHACNNDGWNAITGAYFKKRTDIVDLLFKKGAAFGAKYAEAALLSAYEGGYSDVVSHLLDEMAINPSVADETGISLLAKAVQKGDWPMVKTLCAKKVDVNVFDEKGLPILATLASNGHDQVMALLIENGADVHLASKAGVTAIYQASQYNQCGSVKFLQQSGANINVQTNTGLTPLMAAAGAGYLNLVQFLLKLGANTELQTKKGETAKAIALSNAPRGQYSVLKDTAYKTIAESLTQPGHFVDG